MSFSEYYFMTVAAALPAMHKCHVTLVQECCADVQSCATSVYHMAAHELQQQLSLAARMLIGRHMNKLQHAASMCIATINFRAPKQIRLLCSRCYLGCSGSGAPSQVHIEDNHNYSQRTSPEE